MALAERVFRRLTYREVVPPEAASDEDELQHGMAATDRFLARVPPFSVEGRSVLDVGCGHGVTCLRLAQRGARRVLGIDIQDVTRAERLRDERFPEVADVVEFRQVPPGGDRVGDERFDVVVSQDTFEHVADPEAHVAEMRAALAPGGRLVIGFGALWKSPFGGHLEYMTPVPWAHLVFPERVVLAERRRFRPDESPARYEDVRGDLNRMTLGRFERIMAASGLECEHLTTNASGSRAVALMKVPSRVPARRALHEQRLQHVARPDLTSRPCP